ncbi:MAG: hypothetical protein LLF83_11140 [Methanobacterium sp.]|nr:hypothetical protein [Methanobacterium sp.]
MKKIALVCAMVMLVSIVPAFAMGIDSQVKDQQAAKYQHKYKYGLQNSDSQGNGDQNHLKNEDRVQSQDCSDCQGTGDQEKLQNRLKTQDHLQNNNCTP